MKITRELLDTLERCRVYCISRRGCKGCCVKDVCDEYFITAPRTWKKIDELYKIIE